MKSLVPFLVRPLKSWSSFEHCLERQSGWQQLGAEMYAKALSDYAATGQLVAGSPVSSRTEVMDLSSPPVFWGPPLALIANSKVTAAGRLAGAGRDPRKMLAEALLCKELSSLQEFLEDGEFLRCHGRRKRGCSIRTASWLGLAAAIGAMDVAARWAPLMLEALRNGYLRDENRRGMQHWMLRLWCRAHGVEYPEPPHARHDVAEAVLQIWDTQDTQLLGRWLVQLCNLHTRLSGPHDAMDFPTVFSHFPVEVLLLFRLRAQAGLGNPEVEHPIMQFPWSRLWSVEAAQPDELLVAVYRRLESDEGITVASLYRQIFAGSMPSHTHGP